MSYNGQAEQDKFILNVLKDKRNGYFVEIGSNHPIKINNTYLLESQYDWKGVMVEYNHMFLSSYKIHRPNSIHVIEDATRVNYKQILDSNGAPKNMDYLQIDLEVLEGTTLKTLQLLDSTILDDYKFATVTFEHDIYRTNEGETRKLSREIFERRGYVLVFGDIHNYGPHDVYEDWYVHPDLVDMEHVRQIQRKNVGNYVNNSITGGSIGWKDIQY
jgi:hypothetical protein